MCGLNLSVQACPKNFKSFYIGEVYMLHRGTCADVPYHRTMTIRIGYQGFCGSYIFQCCISLKLFLRLARATCEGNTKFGIFQRWFATF